MPRIINSPFTPTRPNLIATSPQTPINQFLRTQIAHVEHPSSIIIKTQDSQPISLVPSLQLAPKIEITNEKIKSEFPPPPTLNDKTDEILEETDDEEAHFEKSFESLETIEPPLSPIIIEKTEENKKILTTSSKESVDSVIQLDINPNNLEKSANSEIIKELENWFLILEVKKEGKIAQFKIGGYLPGQLDRNKIWYSSMITDRISARELLTKRGTKYKVIGSADINACVDNGIEMHIAQQFVNGFPENWKNILAKQFNTIPNNNSSIIVPLMDSNSFTLNTSNEEILTENTMHVETNLEAEADKKQITSEDEVEIQPKEVEKENSEMKTELKILEKVEVDEEEESESLQIVKKKKENKKYLE